MASDLIRRLGEFRPFHGDRDARLHALLLFVWDYTARLDGFRKTASGIEIGVQGDDVSKVAVAGKTISADGTSETFGVAASTPGLLLPRPGIQGIEAGLFVGTIQVDGDRVEFAEDDLSSTGESKQRPRPRPRSH
jgi:hypothetical protein